MTTSHSIEPKSAAAAAAATLRHELNHLQKRSRAKQSKALWKLIGFSPTRVRDGIRKRKEGRKEGRKAAAELHPLPIVAAAAGATKSIDFSSFSRKGKRKEEEEE